MSTPVALLSFQEWEASLQRLKVGKLQKTLPPDEMLHAAEVASLSITPQQVAGALDSTASKTKSPFVMDDELAIALVTYMLVVSWLDTGGLHKLRKFPDPIGGSDVVVALGDEAKYLRFLQSADRITLLTYSP
jgi:hypothetical protein